ncbi:MAG: malto-oligosyltrehalose synthase [Kineosporiaceae bacterium]
MTGVPLPTATYRLQVQPAFDLAAAADVVAYLADLGVSHLYLAPILQAAPGSVHGYDVVDHARVSADLGGRPALDRLAAAAREHGLGIVLDVVPNHMAVPTPLWHNRALWSVLRDGPGSPFAAWFDIDWSVPHRAVLMPVLGSRIGQVLDAGELSVEEAEIPAGPDGAPVTERILRYHEHVLPVRPGTGDLPLPLLVDRQWYRLAHWRVAAEELNYRRFFDVDTLAAVRVEDPAVFDATHAVLLDLFRDGVADGFRIDHPDGLADPGGYLALLRDRATGAGGRRPWIVVEKITEGDEEVPGDWACDGTTGYDALRRVTGILTNPFAAAELHGLHTDLAGDEADSFEAIAEQAKREVVADVQYAEVQRLVDLLVDVCHDDVRLRDHTRRGLHEAVIELLVAMDRYRAYVVPGEPTPPESVAVVEAAAARAREHLAPERSDTLDVVVHLVLGRDPSDDPRRRELVVRFQQTCGPVMAKGVEDTAFYRWHRLVALNEVGGDPTRLGSSAEEFHAVNARVVERRPATMTTLTTHDTKRSEDARARLLAAVDEPRLWVETVRGWHEAAAGHRVDGFPEGSTEYLIWQTLVAAWPLDGDRLVGYLLKAVREAKRHTSWTAPDESYEAAVTGFARAVLDDGTLRASVEGFLTRIAPRVRTIVLGQKLLQLAMPGVADVYQGSELVTTSLVDPDNRRPVDYAERRHRLARLDAGGAAADLDDEKLLVTSRALRLRRELPDAFRGPRCRYWPVPVSSGGAVAFGRGTVDDDRPSVVALATCRPADLERHGGWSDHVVVLPEGSWVDVVAGRPTSGGSVPLQGILEAMPVALLRRID